MLIEQQNCTQCSLKRFLTDDGICVICQIAEKEKQN